jgi:hypothetical protein
LGTGPCTRCNIDARLRELLDDGTGRIRPELTSLHHNLLHAEQPDTVLTWPAKNSGAAILRQLAARDRPLTHEALDETAGHQAAQDLRAILVATGALPVQTNMARLEQAITRTIGQRDDPDEQHLLRRYAIWHMLRRLRSRNRGAETTPIQATNLMRHLRRTPQLLDWLTAGRLSLHTARQGDLDSWLTSDGADRQREIGHFIRWTPHGGCFREENPSGTSAPTASPNGSANSGCGPDKLGPPRCSNSAPGSRRLCSPGCSASTSPSRSPGNTPAPATGPPTPPTSAADALDRQKRKHHDQPALDHRGPTRRRPY